MKNWLRKIKKRFLYFFVGPFTINWDNWEKCYDYGRDTIFFFKGKLCRCKHRHYDHRKYSQNATRKHFIQGCVECNCIDFERMNNLDWVEYANERVAQVQFLSDKDHYDYFMAVSRGERER